MLDKYRKVKRGKPYLIFGLTDETFSVLCAENPPPELDRDRVYFWVTFLDHCYWVAGTLLGAVIGSLITFDTTGMDFALTALFVVIFTGQWEERQGHGPALLGLGRPWPACSSSGRISLSSPPWRESWRCCSRSTARARERKTERTGRLRWMEWD